MAGEHRRGQRRIQCDSDGDAAVLLDVAVAGNNRVVALKRQTFY